MSGPIRGLHDVEGQLFAVSGNTLYQISNAGVAIPRGSIPGVGRVSMAHNQVSGGNQLTIVNGAAGYVWDTSAQTFTIITDEGFPGSSVTDFIDGYMMHVEPFGRFLLHSDLADALDFNTLDRFEAETSPDKTVGMIVNHQEVWAFGERTIDVFANAGTARGTFENKGISITRGCIAKASPAVIDNGTAWLGDDRVVYHARGYDPVRISTRAIEVALSECSLTDIRNAFSFVWADRGHSVYYLTVPNGPTFGYDFSTGLWHRRASWHPERDISGRWMLSDLVRSNGKWIGGDYRNGKLYELDWDYLLEGCEPLIRERVSPVAHNNGARFTVDSVELLFDTGGPEVACVPFPFQPVGPQISGNAPDGLTSEPYTFTYTTTQGTAPITQTVLLDTVLPEGWSWDELTATISHDDTPVAIGIISLKMRVFDANGLYADHEDDFVIAQEHFLLVTGTEIVEDEPFSTALALEPLAFGTIDVDLDAAIPGFHGGTWAAATNSAVVYSTDRVTWTAGTLSLTGTIKHLVGGEDGWIAVSSNANQIAISGPTPDTFTAHAITASAYAGAPEAVAEIGFVRYVDGAWWAAGGQTGLFGGALLSSPTLDETVWTNVSGTRPDDIVFFHDFCKFGGSCYATVTANFSSNRAQLRRSDDDGATWPHIIIDIAPGGLKLFQLEPGIDHLLVYCFGGAKVYTSADNFAAAHDTGIETTTGSFMMTAVIGRQIRYAEPRFYIMSGAYSDPAKANKCVSTLDGIDFDDPVDLGISAAKGIATDYVLPEPEEDE